MRRIRLALIALAALVCVSACHTIEGVGKDIKSAGGAIEGAGNNR
jgi:predicted small secreted protein